MEVSFNVPPLVLAGVVVPGLALHVGMHERDHAEPIPGRVLGVELVVERGVRLVAPPPAPVLALEELRAGRP